MGQQVIDQIAYALAKAKKKKIDPASCALCRPHGVPKHIKAGREKLTAIETNDGKMVVMGPIPEKEGV